MPNPVTKLTNISLNILVQASTKKFSAYFDKKINHYQEVQNNILLACVEKNKDTRFGLQYGFASMKAVADFQRNVPIMPYEEYRPWIKQIENGEQNILTAEPVTLFEPTGGSSGGTKLIPYTSTLKKEFQKAVHPWINDLYCSWPKIKKGRSYWSISPALHEQSRTCGGIPVGFEDDSSYLGVAGRIMQQLFVTPQSIRTIENSELFKCLTALYLLSAEDLTLISVWNPTFLSGIISVIHRYSDVLMEALYNGTFKIPPTPEFESVNLDAVPLSLPKKRDRVRLLEIALSQQQVQWHTVWKNLECISCWMDGPARQFAQSLKADFSNVHFQPKGLLATEGVFSFPLTDAGGCVVAYTSHFFEFLEEGTDTPLTLNQLEPDPHKTYSVLITTGGGLYRYAIGDRILVKDLYHSLPIIEFVGRTGTSDLVGEKLEEHHVESVLIQALNQCNVTPSFMLFSPVVEKEKRYYALFLESETLMTKKSAEPLLTALEQALSANWYYRQARELKQLDALQLFIISGSGTEQYMQGCIGMGQKMGDIKPRILDKRSGWEQRFSGSFLFLDP